MDYDKKLVDVFLRKTRTYLEEFDTWLAEKKLSKKTIQKHHRHVEFYVNTFLTYYIDFVDTISIKDGCYYLDSFLGDFFIHKCTWASPSSIKDNAVSIKKFYACMLEKKHIEKRIMIFFVKLLKQRWIDGLR